jgi:hypothetical protein
VRSVLLFLKEPMGGFKVAAVIATVVGVAE